MSIHNINVEDWTPQISVSKKCLWLFFADSDRNGICRNRRVDTGLRVARGYQSTWLSSDMRAGLSVAAVAVPTGIAYAQLVGVPPVVGLYASLLPPVAYAFFGSCCR